MNCVCPPTDNSGFTGHVYQFKTLEDVAYVVSNATGFDLHDLQPFVYSRIRWDIWWPRIRLSGVRLEKQAGGDHVTRVPQLGGLPCTF